MQGFRVKSDLDLVRVVLQKHLVQIFASAEGTLDFAFEALKQTFFVVPSLVRFERTVKQHIFLLNNLSKLSSNLSITWLEISRSQAFKADVALLFANLFHVFILHW